MDEVKSLFDNQLIAAVENLIKNADKYLLLVSPFIDLDKRIHEALRGHISKHDFKLCVLYGKNENNIYKSIKKDSLDFLKQFPNVEIRYNERLHAKFYLNDYHWIVTSLNLYDYSLAKNIEVGVICNYASKGILGKVVDNSAGVLFQGIEKVVKQDVLGKNKEIDCIEQFENIFNNSELKYKTKPIIIDESGIKGMVGYKKLNGFIVEADNLSQNQKAEQQPIKESQIPIRKEEAPIIKQEGVSSNSTKILSAKQLSTLFNVQQNDITYIMQKAGYINNNKITELGHSKGLGMKNYMGNDYIVYPESLEEFNRFRK